MKNIIFLFALFTLLSACQKEQLEISHTQEERFFLEIDHAILPVIVKGNITSKAFCIFLHGGPGDSGIKDFYATNSFNKVEEEIALVYFDQRCAGLSQGNCNAKDLEIQDFVQDIDQLILLLQHRYGEDISLFLLGHSWGATLALDYLVNGEHRTDIKGCIQSNGSHSIPMLSREQQRMMNVYAEEQIALGNSPAEWEKLNDGIKDLDATIFEDRIAIVEQTYKTLAPLMEDGIINKINTQVDNPLYYLSNSFLTSHSVQVNNNRPFYEKLLAYDLTEQLEKIKTPMGLYWGRHDLVHPPIMAKTIFEKLGSPEKELYFFEKSHHAPMVHENELYQEKVKAFIELYLG